MKGTSKPKADQKVASKIKSLKSSVRQKDKQTGQEKRYLYTLEVFLRSGPVTEEFLKRNPIISRTIEILGDQTLEMLHDTIFEAFEREEEHMYEFQIGGKGPQDPKAKRYVLPGEVGDPFESSKPAGYVTQTTIGSLGLKVDQAFGYWFDFGDDWWHQINVIQIGEEFPNEAYPRVIKREGDSPPQYPDEEDEE